MATYYSIEQIACLAEQDIGVSKNKARTKAQLYHDAVCREMVYGYHVLATTRQIRENQIPFSLQRIRARLGRYGKPQKYWWDWLHQKFPLIKLIKIGNSIKGELSMAEPQIPIEIILANGNGKDLVKAIYQQFEELSEIHLAPLNLYSLENYILATRAESNKNQTIQRNLKQAELIFAIGKECNGKLPMVVNFSSFGRTYYKGVNLQNVHKTVRHAALGACYSVDIDSAVFNWKYSMVDFQEELTYTRELIQDKQRVRSSLAQLVFGNSSDHSIKTIKRVLTAISFGARGETRCWFKQDGEWTQGSVSEIIHSKELRDLLFNDAWMKQFMQEQDRINKFIGDNLAQAAQQGLIPEKYLKELRSERGRISRGKLISWAYQQSEQQVMRDMLTWARAEPLLQIHDGVYFKTKPDLPSMQTALRNHWPLAKLSIEQIDDYHYRNKVLDQEHLAFIRKEEFAANLGLDPRVDGVHTETAALKQYDAHSEPNWEYMMAQAFADLEPQQDPNMPDFVKQRLRISN
jgi:hypothetical protein